MTTRKIYLSVALISVSILLFIIWYISLVDKKTPTEETPYVPETGATTTVTNVPEKENPEIIGASVSGRKIENYIFGNGSTTILFVGGIHGGYEWNSVLLAYEFITELENGKFIIPEDIRVMVVPVLNPDGLYEVVGKEGRFAASEIPQNNAHETGQGRFNKNGVDLNRNFDCKWQPKSTWRGKTVAAGSEAFSEPEAKALRKLVTEQLPAAVIFWHSKANAVYASECNDGILTGTLKLMSAYAKAANYQAVDSFDAYPVTGDAEGWLASINIPAITVELETRTETEWGRNRKGIESILSLY